MKKLLIKIDKWLDEEVSIGNDMIWWETNNYTLVFILLAWVILLTIITIEIIF